MLFGHRGGRLDSAQWKKTNYEKSSFWAGFKEPHRISWSKDKVVVIPIMEEWEMLALLYKNLITQGKC